MESCLHCSARRYRGWGWGSMHWLSSSKWNLCRSYSRYRPTRKGRMLTVILAPKGENVYYAVTARPASRKERSLYTTHQGGEKAAWHNWNIKYQNSKMLRKRLVFGIPTTLQTLRVNSSPSKSCLPKIFLMRSMCALSQRTSANWGMRRGKKVLAQRL